MGYILAFMAGSWFGVLIMALFIGGKGGEE